MAKRVVAGRRSISARTAAQAVQVDPRQLAMFLKEAIQGAAPIAAPLYTLREVWAWWKDIFLGAMKSKETREGHMENHLLPSLGDLNSETMTQEVVEAAFAKLTRVNAASDKRVVRPLGPQSLKHIRNTGRKVINDAIRLQKWKGKNPFVGLKSLPKVRKKKHRETLTPREALALLAQLKPSYRPAFAIAIYLGMRKSEILLLKQRDIRLDRKVIIIRRFKTGVESEVPIPEELIPHIHAALSVAHGEYLFSRPDGRPLRADTKLELVLLSALGRAGIVYGYDHKCRWCGRLEHLQHNARHGCDRCGKMLWVTAVARKITFHGLRHVCSNLHRRAGCDPLVIRELLGHEVDGLAVTDTVYTHIDEEYMRRELNRLSLFQEDGTPEGSGGGPTPSAASGGKTENPPSASGAEGHRFDSCIARNSTVEPTTFLTPKEVGSLLRVCTATVRKLHRRGHLSGTWVGQKLLISTDDLRDFLAKGGAR